MPTVCACGNQLAPKPVDFKCTSRPCRCEKPARPDLSAASPTVFLRGTPKDPKRAALGLPHLTELEKSVLKGTIHE